MEERRGQTERGREGGRDTAKVWRWREKIRSRVKEKGDSNPGREGGREIIGGSVRGGKSEEIREGEKEGGREKVDRFGRWMWRV